MIIDFGATLDPKITVNAKSVLPLTLLTQDRFICIQYIDVNFKSFGNMIVEYIFTLSQFGF